MLSLSPSSVLDRWQAGDLPGYRLLGKKGGPVRFRLAEIEAALESWHVNASDSSPNSKPNSYSTSTPTPPTSGNGRGRREARKSDPRLFSAEASR
jgi:hypothetical protein